MVRVAQGRVTLFGKCVGGLEDWSTSFALTQVDSKSDAELDTAAAALNTLFIAEIWDTSDLRNYFTDTVTYLGVRLDDVRNPGGVARTAFAGPVAPLAGSNTNPSLPPQNSLVVSLRTALPGARARGRMYLPPMAVAYVDDNGLMDPSFTGDVADNFAAFFTAVNSSVAIDETVVVASDAGQTLTPVTYVQVGRVFDTQRRRRAEILESYETRAV